VIEMMWPPHGVGYETGAQSVFPPLRIHDPSFPAPPAGGAPHAGNLIADTMAIMASLGPGHGGVDK